MKTHRGYIILFIVILLLTGCKSNKEKEDKIQKKDKAPSSLSDFSQGIQEILYDVEEIEKILDGADMEMNEEKDQKDDNKDKSKPENGKEEEKDKEKEKENKLQQTWTNIDTKIDAIHNQWDLYGVEGIKMGISMNIKDELEESLNSLTRAIEEKDITGIYENASQTMLGLEPVFHFYKDEIKGNTNKIKYYTYQSYLNAMNGKKTKAQDLLEDLVEQLNVIRTKLENDEEKIKILDRLNVSIESMKFALKEDSIKLYRIKKDLIIKNINELEK